MSAPQDEIPPPPPPPPSSSQTPTQQTPHTVSTIKLPILKKGEYDIWAMKMEHYLAHTDYPIWEVIQNGNGPVSITTDTSGQIKVLPPRTAEEIVARERERKARTTLLMALPEDHLAKFHKMTDAKEMWDAIKSRFGGNDESKKMQKYILKQQFEGFSVSNTEGLHKGYDRSLPSAWLQVSLIMRTKPGVDTLSFDDLKWWREFQIGKENLLGPFFFFYERQEHEAKDTAEKYGFGFSKDTEEHLRQADMVPTGSIDPAASISAGSIDPAASISAGSAEPFPTVIEPVHADETSFTGHSLGTLNDHSTRFPSPSDLAIHTTSARWRTYTHLPSTDISLLFIDADLVVLSHNLAPIVAFDHFPLTMFMINKGIITQTIYIVCLLVFLSQLEPSSVAQALNDSDWVEAMQEEMQQFINQKVWKLVPLPDGKIAIGTK
ncbi:hypothetical protein Tco_0459858 [Tanacetum coccineum]